MKSTLHTPALIALAVAAALAAGAAPQAAAANSSPAIAVQDDQANECQRSRRGADRRDRDSGRQAPVEERYPDATRESPKEGASARMGQRLNRLNNAMNDQDYAEALVQAQDILDQDRANDYDKAYASNMAGHASYNTDDVAGAKRYIAQAIEYDALDNNNHLQAILMLAQLHAQDEENDQALTLLDRYFTESGSKEANDLALRGQVLYQAERYEEAIPALREAIDAAEEPNSSWTQALMASYAETGREAEATALAEQIASSAPDDKRSQMNLASMYLQMDQVDKAVAVMERLRAAGQLTEDREYRNLMAMHLNNEGGEAKAIEVINEGLSKGVLEGNHQTYLALAQAYYFSDQPEPAIDAYRKAAPLADNGETFLNLARVLYGEGREAEAAEAARQAIAKGVRNEQDARRIIGN